MPIYRFEAVDKAGAEVQDSIDALSVEEARHMILQMGYFVTKIAEVAGQTTLLDKWLTTLRGPFRSLMRFFKKRTVQAHRRVLASNPAQDKADDKKPTPKSAPARQAQAAHGGTRKIGEVLIDLGFLHEDQLWDVLDEAKITGDLTGQVAILRGLITEEQLIQALAEQHGLKVVDLEDARPQPEAVGLVPQKLATTYKLLPLRLTGYVLTVAIGDPNSLTTVVEDLRNFLGVEEVLAMLASPKAIEAATRRFYGKEESIADIINSLEAGLPRQNESVDLERLMEVQDAQPVRKFINMVLLLAIKDRASDIHFEPFEDEYKMRYRCGGVLYEIVPPPRHLAGEIADRFKVMANLDVAERRLSQHGRIELDVGGNPVDLRVSVLPTMFGESVVIRVLDPTIVSFDLNKVGMDPRTLQQFRWLIHEPNGMILFAGPPGTGKTTTLYSALSELNEISHKIITAEDPVEYSSFDGVVRCQIRHDLGFASALPCILGQNPDIIAIGAIGDQETAQVAVQAALSGRLVLSTVDAADAASSITRLRGMGLEPSAIAATLKGVLAQRLLRKTCEDCRTEFEPSAETLMELNLRPQDVRGKKFYYGRGCDRCNNTGHKGRCGLFELVTMNDELRGVISTASTDQLRAHFWAHGMTTLREAGMKAIHDGVTTIEEVAHLTVLLG